MGGGHARCCRLLVFSVQVIQQGLAEYRIVQFLLIQQAQMLYSWQRTPALTNACVAQLVYCVCNNLVCESAVAVGSYVNWQPG